MSTKVATVSPELIKVFPYTRDSCIKRFSPSSKNFEVLSFPASRYFTKNVKSVIPVASFGNE